MRLVTFGFLCALTLGATGRADEILFESATLGPTGITPEEASSGVGSALSMGSDIFLGARFQLDEPVVTTSIGGHVVPAVGTPGTFFGAIVKLDGPDDLPDSVDLTTTDVLGTTSLMFPEASADVFGDLQLQLDPGWYGVVFGAGLFGTDGLGGMPRNNAALGDTSYFSMRVGLPWVTPSADIRDGIRLVVRGSVIPEPVALPMLAVLSVVQLCAARRF